MQVVNDKLYRISNTLKQWHHLHKELSFMQIKGYWLTRGTRSQAELENFPLTTLNQFKT